MKVKNSFLFVSSICITLFFLISQPLCARFYSQCGQDKYLYENFFKDKKNGIFVDIGAHNGITYSNTYFFEKILNWTGICIEPIPEIFRKLSKNRNCICINGCISDQNKTAQFLMLDGSSIKPGCVEPYPEMLSGLMDNYDPRHLARINQTIIAYGGQKHIIEVQCYQLNYLLDKYNIDHVDYLSIDTEGGELDILKSINFDKITIYIIDVENNYSYPEIKSFMEAQGYMLIKRLSSDEIYVKKEWLLKMKPF